MHPGYSFCFAHGRKQLYVKIFFSILFNQFFSFTFTSMNHYRISYQHPRKHFVDITLTLDNLNRDKFYLQLPAWRPGRYELGNFAKNIQRFAIYDSENNPVPFRKVSKDRWEAETTGLTSISAQYNFYAATLDAGNSWLDETQLYLNFVNCMLYAEDRINEPCQVRLDLPDDYQIACGLSEIKKHVLQADNYYQLADSPMIASNQLTHWQYTAGGVPFHIWIMGEVVIDKAKVLEQFWAFTENQIALMGDFPANDYHFLFQFMPYRYYHGVEHGNSTVIALGPSESIKNDDIYQNFLGVSSHELFHAWNIIKIRPAEMMPYDFTKENYFPTGFVAEGVTTYYGDLFLVRSGVFSKTQYFTELNTLFRRHFENFGRFNHSLTDSSHDLWLDGYSLGIPGRKVSIYVKGALVSLILDLELRRLTQNARSLDSLMPRMWETFGKKSKGYTLNDLQSIITELSGGQLTAYFEAFIFGKVPLEEKLQEVLRSVGCQLTINEAVLVTERNFGFRTFEENGKLTISGIEPGSSADMCLALGDELIAVNGRKIAGNLNDLAAKSNTLELTFFRHQQLRTATLNYTGTTYYRQYTIQQRENASEVQQYAFELWLGCGW